MSSYPYPAPGTPYAPPAFGGHDPTAVMGRRVGAWIVDTVIVAAPAAALLTSDLEYLEEGDLDGQSGVDFCEDYMDQTDGVCVDVGDRVYFSDGLPAAPWLVGLGVSLLFLVLLQGLKGWTPGKLLFGVRTVGEDGQAPGLGRALVRWLLLIIDGLCLGLVGFIVALTNRSHRRVGDMAAKTYVVSKEYAGRPIVVPGVTPSYAAYPGSPGAPGPPGAPGAPGGGWGPPPSGPPGQPSQPTEQGAPSWGAPPAWGDAPRPADETPRPAGGPVSAPGPAASERAPFEPASGTTAPETATPDTATSETAAPGTATSDTAAPDTAELERVAPETDTSDAGGQEATVPPSEGSERERSPTGADATASQQSQTPGYNPQWDAARGTYIVWSAERGQWLGWDDAAKEWKPL
jgi:RDD family